MTFVKLEVQIFKKKREEPFEIDFNFLECGYLLSTVPLPHLLRQTASTNQFNIQLANEYIIISNYAFLKKLIKPIKLK